MINQLLFSPWSSSSWKKPGVSLIMTFGITFVVMVFAIFLLSSVLSSLERTADIEQSNEIFYATEAGLEAAFFHANVRGMGVHFCDDESDNCISEETDPSQIITLNNGTVVTWAIKGRAKEVGGELRPHEYIEIPFFWDGATNPRASEEPVKLTDGFTVGFGEIPNPESGEYYGNSEEEVLIDWTLRGEDGGGERLTFYPFTDNKENPCQDGDTTFICDDAWQAMVFKFKSNAANFKGIPIPEKSGLEKMKDFVDDYGNKAVFSFQSVLDYPAGISGIPYTISAGTSGGSSATLPTPNYTAFANVKGDGFRRQIAIEVPHQKKRGVFSYVVFD